MQNKLFLNITVLSIVIIYTIVAICRCIYHFILTIFKEIHSLYKLNEENKFYEEENKEISPNKLSYSNPKDKLKQLLSYTENKLYYQVEKTEFPAPGRIREYVNFFTYDRETVAVENANDLINDILNNVLCIYKGKNKKLYNTIVLDDYACDKKDMSRVLAEKLDVEEIRMVIA